LSVSVEDKIELFRNIIYREIEESVSEKELKAKEEFEKEKSKLMTEVEAKRKSIIEEAVSKAEREKQQIIAKANAKVYRQVLDRKQQLIKEMIELLMQKAVDFTGDEGYRVYLSRCLGRAADAMEASESVRLYFTGKDMESLGEFINQEVSKGKLKGKYTMEEASNYILGGFYAEDGEQEIQVDYTLRSLIEDNHELIGKYISQSFDEVQADGH